MTMQSPLADMLVRIRNAQARLQPSTTMPASKLKSAVAKVLLDEGYIQSFSERGETVSERELVIGLKYYAGKPVISEIQMISRPGLRQYCGRKSIPRVKNDYGITIMSTSQGIMSGQRARKLGIGGEILCEVF
ncbi:MAG: 30S ribosomal protein S8 [Gammaproteobacteria bacterium AqS3]|nr:30S ribosomal protein S8 [Gammaproteobacteria bacterium AqS3]